MTEKKILLFALCICAKDGLISSIEAETILTQFNESVKNKDLPFKKLSNASFKKIIEQFFASDKQLEDYCQDIKETKNLDKILEIAKISASSDGFDILENIAYRKALALLDKN